VVNGLDEKQERRWGGRDVKSSDHRVVETSCWFESGQEDQAVATEIPAFMRQITD